MKKYMVVLAAIAMVIAMAGAAMAATTSSSVAATATIANKCVAGGSPALAFGSLDGSMVGPYPATVTNPTLFCTSGDTITVTDDGGLSGTTGGVPVTGTSWNLKSGANLIPYTLTYTTSLTGAGFSTDLGGSGAGKLSLSASIANGAIATVPAGSYTDTVVITYTY